MRRARWLIPVIGLLVVTLGSAAVAAPKGASQPEQSTGGTGGATGNGTGNSTGNGTGNGTGHGTGGTDGGASGTDGGSDGTSTDGGSTDGGTSGGSNGTTVTTGTTGPDPTTTTGGETTGGQTTSGDTGGSATTGPATPQPTPDTTGGDEGATSGATPSGGLGGATEPDQTDIPPAPVQASPEPDDRSDDPSRRSSKISGGRYLMTVLRTVRNEGGVEGQFTVVVKELEAAGIDGGWTVLLRVDNAEGRFVPAPASALGAAAGDLFDHAVEVPAGNGAVNLFDVLSQSSSDAYDARYAQTGTLRLESIDRDGPRPTVTVTVLQ